MRVPVREREKITKFRFVLNRNSTSGLSGKGRGLRVRVCDTVIVESARATKKEALEPWTKKEAWEIFMNAPYYLMSDVR